MKNKISLVMSVVMALFLFISCGEDGKNGNDGKDGGMV